MRPGRRQCPRFRCGRSRPRSNGRNSRIRCRIPRISKRRTASVRRSPSSSAANRKRSRSRPERAAGSRPLPTESRGSRAMKSSRQRANSRRNSRRGSRSRPAREFGRGSWLSVSLVRFDDASRLDASRTAEACHAQCTYLLLDISQCCGATPLDVGKLGADFLVCAGYKWILSPYGTGFFWVRSDLIETLRPGPFYWMALQGADRFHSLVFDDPKPAPGAARWDSPETSSFFNLAAMDATLEFVLRVGPETVAEHNRALIEMMYERLPRDRCIATSPLDPARRGPYGCFAARTPEKTAALYERLRKENVIVSLREG